ncbi:MAG TPA: hypothetical protein VMC78_20435, partial [Mycobacterium sp.]|nr:hypothetical protein [Mycobacterium sp.]
MSKTGSRATVQRCTDASPTGSPPPGDQHIDKTGGAQPAAPTEKIREFRGKKVLVKGQVGMAP